MADMKKVYDDLMIINLYVQFTITLIDVKSDYWYPQPTKLTRGDNTGC